MPTTEIENTFLPEKAFIRRWVRAILSFTVGVAIGLAPFLGELDVPGFTPLLSLFPPTLKSVLLPTSAFLMGIIGAISQFYSGTSISLKRIQVYAKRAIISMAVFFILLLLSYYALVRRVHFKEDLVVSVVTGLVRQDSCGCPKSMPDALCIKSLSANPDEVEGCWGSLQVQLSHFVLSVLYLFLTGSFALFIGLLLLLEKNKPRARSPRRA